MKNILICILAVAMLSACGIKPKAVKSPSDSKERYPHVYPQPTADDQR